METNIHDLVLESMDAKLILAEGFIDTTKKTLKKVIDKIIELCKKFISFLKDKLTKGLDVATTIVKSVILTQKEADKVIYSLVSDNAKVNIDDYREEIEKCDNIFAKYRDDLMITFKDYRDLNLPKLHDLNKTIMEASGKMLNSIDKLDAAINAIKNNGQEENLSILVNNLTVVEHSLMDLTRRLNLIQTLIGISTRAASKVY